MFTPVGARISQHLNVLPRGFGGGEGAGEDGPARMTCSSRGCRQDATWAVVWSNPAIHYGRTKTWLACDDHDDTLSSYLKQRSFPVEVIALDEYLSQQDSTD